MNDEAQLPTPMMPTRTLLLTVFPLGGGYRRNRRAGAPGPARWRLGGRRGGATRGAAEQIAEALLVGGDGLAVEPAEDLAALAPGADDPGLAQDAEMPAHARLAHLAQLGQLRDPDLLDLGEQ